MGKIFSIIVASLFAASLVMSSCNTSGCTDNQSALPLAGFYSASTDQAISVSTLEIYGVGAPGDSVLYQSGEALSIAYLPFRSTSETTSYVFHYTQEGLEDDAFNDTLTFTYTSSPFFASEQCGAMLNYHIETLKHTNHIIESVEITDSLVTNTDRERIKIYFRTSTDETP